MAKKDRKDGDYFRSEGSYRGAVYHKGKWHSFRCIYCLNALGLQRRPVNATPTILKATQRRPFDIEHYPEHRPMEGEL